MSQRPSSSGVHRRGPGRLRTSVVSAAAVLALALSGCGEPDDDDGDGGGGYLAQESAGSTSAPADR